VRAIYDWAAVTPHWGKLTDRQIADRFYIPRVIVSNRRNHLGIQVVRKWDEHKHLLGTMPDGDLAAIVGVGRNAVTVKRIRMGISSFNTSLENKVETAFCKTLKVPYQRQVATPLGRIDVLADTTIYECKYRLRLAELHKALGQLICYDYSFSDREMAIVCAEIAIPDQAIDFLKYSFGIEIIVVEPPATSRPQEVE